MSLKTKFGSVRLNSDGYYQICSDEYGNNLKLWHRLIWENFYGVEIPKGYIIHHKNEIKTDNCILNLQLMEETEHKKLHQTGKVFSKERRDKISKAVRKIDVFNVKSNKSHNIDYSVEMSKRMNNSTGYFRVSKHISPKFKQGFTWKYRYYDENGKRHSIYSIDIETLKERVLERGLEWKVLD